MGSSPGWAYRLDRHDHKSDQWATKKTIDHGVPTLASVGIDKKLAQMLSPALSRPTAFKGMLY
jgi:hypothetical protein